jgi:hypothetical protein
MKISEIITDKYKLRIPPTVYYDLLADVVEAEEEQEPTTKNDLGVDCISRDDVWDVMQELWGTSGELIDRLMSLPSVTPQEPFINKPCISDKQCEHDKNVVLDKIYADIQKLRGCSCSCSDGIIDDVEDIIDKYKGESENP